MTSHGSTYASEEPSLFQPAAAFSRAQVRALFNEAPTEAGLSTAPQENTDQERYSDRMEGRFSSPASQTVQRRARFSTCFDSICDGLSGVLDRLSNRLNGLLGLFELGWAIDILQGLTFADHLSSPRQRGRSTPEPDNRSKRRCWAGSIRRRREAPMRWRRSTGT